MARPERKTIKRTIEVETHPDQAWFWTEEWQARERSATAQIEAGQTTFYESGEELLAALRKMQETGEPD
jgi:hypothetical protein